MDKKCWSCEGYWDWILSNGLCMVCNAYKFTESDPNSPIVEIGKDIGQGKPEDIRKEKEK